MRARACFVYLIVILSLYNYFYKPAKSNSIFTGQHDHPVVPVPTHVERYLGQREVCVGDHLAGVFMPIAVFVDHDSRTALHQDLDQDEPVASAYLIHVAGYGVHDPPALRTLTEVANTIGQQVSAAQPVVVHGAGELGQAGLIQAQCL